MKLIIMQKCNPLPRREMSSGATMDKFGNLEAVIWDMDGVLIDSGQKHFEAFQIMFWRHGIEIPEKIFEDTFGMPNVETIKLVTDGKIGQAEVEKWSQEKEDIFCELICEGDEFMPGIKDWLDRFSNNCIVQALATSGTWQSIHTILDVLQAEDCFKAITSGDDGAAKPDPAIFLKASSAMDVLPAKCLVIEDSPVGLTAAKAAGMKAIAITTTHPPVRLAKANLILSDLTELHANQIITIFQ